MNKKRRRPLKPRRKRSGNNSGRCEERGRGERGRGGEGEGERGRGGEGEGGEGERERGGGRGVEGLMNESRS